MKKVYHTYVADSNGNLFVGKIFTNKETAIQHQMEQRSWMDWYTQDELRAYVEKHDIHEEELIED